MSGSTIDYEESLQGAGFKVEQPQRRRRLRLRLLLPGRRGGAGLSGLRHAGQLAALLLVARRDAGARAALRQAARRTTSAHRAARPASPTGPAFGLTEDNADLLWSSDGRASLAGGLPGRRAGAHRTASELSASARRLGRPAARSQSRRPRSRPRSAAVRGRWDRAASYAGLRDELAAVASQQRAAGGGGGFQVVIDIFGTPAWAARAPSGCERLGTRPFSRPLSAAAIADYRALIASLLALGDREGVALDWWSPWNEPNDPVFISPQRAACAARCATVLRPPSTPSSPARWRPSCVCTARSTICCWAS